MSAKTFTLFTAADTVPGKDFALFTPYDMILANHVALFISRDIILANHLASFISYDMYVVKSESLISCGEYAISASKIPFFLPLYSIWEVFYEKVKNINNGAKVFDAKQLIVAKTTTEVEHRCNLSSVLPLHC